MMARDWIPNASDKAISKGLIDEHAMLDESALYQLIFEAWLFYS